MSFRGFRGLIRSKKRSSKGSRSSSCSKQSVKNWFQAGVGTGYIQPETNLMHSYVMKGQELKSWQQRKWIIQFCSNLFFIPFHDARTENAWQLLQIQVAFSFISSWVSVTATSRSVMNSVSKIIVGQQTSVYKIGKAKCSVRCGNFLWPRHINQPKPRSSTKT